MSVIKTLKNVSGQDLQLLNVVVSNNGSFTVPTHLWLELANDSNIENYINVDQVIVNNGTSDLSKVDGLKLIKKFQIEEAKEVLFDNTTNGFISDNVQDAIEESKTSVVGSMFQTLFENNGTSSNIWLNYGANPASSNSVFTLMPFNCKLVACSFTNAASSADLDIQVNIANQGSGNTVNRTIIFQVRNDRVATFSFPNSSNSNLLLNQGDKVGVYIQDQGDNANDPVVTLYFKVLEEVDQNTQENFSTNLSTTLAGTTVTFSQ